MDISLQSPRVHFSSFFFFFHAIFHPPPFWCAWHRPRNFPVPRFSVCVSPFRSHYFQIAIASFPLVVKCRTLRLRGPALLRFRSSSVARFSFFSWNFRASLRTRHKSDCQVESSDRFPDIRFLATGPCIRQFAVRRVRQSAHQVVSQGYFDQFVGGYSVCRVLHLVPVRCLLHPKRPPLAVIVHDSSPFGCRIRFFAFSPSSSVFFHRSFEHRQIATFSSGAASFKVTIHFRQVLVTPHQTRQGDSVCLRFDRCLYCTDIDWSVLIFYLISYPFW